MANIDTYLQQILAAIYGEDVRGSIHDAIEAINDQVDAAEETMEQFVQGAMDTTLTSTTKPAEGKAVGDAVDDLKSALSDEASWYTLPIQAVNGYFISSDGEVIENQDYSYSELFETDNYDEFIFMISSSTLNSMWLQLCFYDWNTEAFLTRMQIINTDRRVRYASEKWINNTTEGKYKLRLTWGSSNRELTVLKAPTDTRFKENITASINANNRNNAEQILIELGNINSFIDSSHSLGYAIDITPRPNIKMNCGVIDCIEGDIFTITGVSSPLTPIFAFIDNDNKLLRLSSNDTYARQIVVEAPANASKCIINVLNTQYYCIYKGSGSNSLNYGSRLSTKNYDQHFINTNKRAFETVDLTPIYFSTYCCAVVECTSGEAFTISGCAGNGGRLWAFLNEDNKLLTKSPANAHALMETVIAPNSAKKLVLNSVKGFLKCEKGLGNKASNDILLNSIPVPMIHELPKDVTAMPTVTFSKYVQENEGVSGAKPAIYKNGNNFCLTYGENIDNSGTDIPMFTGNGVLAMKYKYFKLVNGVETNVQYGTFAQMGTTYIDCQGDSIAMVGGAGLPSGVDGMQYFTTPYLKEDADASYSFAGIQKYGMTPCCCTVTVNDTGVTFGTIYELKLNINGVIGKFDMHRIDNKFYNGLTYLTTSAPYHDANGYKWLQPVTNGIAYLTSNDGITWIYRFTVKTDYQPVCEVACVYKNNMLYFAARTSTRVCLVTDTLYIGKISTDGYIALEYRLPFVETRPYVVKSGNDILLFYTPANKQIAECIRICEYENSELFFWRWFTVYKNSTWYITCYKQSVENNAIEHMYIAGGNGQEGSTTGMTFIELTFDTSKAYTPAEIPAIVS